MNTRQLPGRCIALLIAGLMAWASSARLALPQEPGPAPTGGGERAAATAPGPPVLPALFHIVFDPVNRGRLLGDKAEGSVVLFLERYKLPANSGGHKIPLRATYALEDGIVSSLVLNVFSGGKDQPSLEALVRHLEGLGEVVSTRRADNIVDGAIQALEKALDVPGEQDTSGPTTRPGHTVFTLVKPRAGAPSFCFRTERKKGKVKWVTLVYPYDLPKDSKGRPIFSKSPRMRPTSRPRGAPAADMLGVPVMIGARADELLKRLNARKKHRAVVLRHAVALPIGDSEVVCTTLSYAIVGNGLMAAELFFPAKGNRARSLEALKTDSVGARPGQLDGPGDAALPGVPYGIRWRRARSLSEGIPGYGISLVLNGVEGFPGGVRIFTVTERPKKRTVR